MYTRMRNHRRRRARKDPFVGWRRDHTLSDRTPAARCGPRRPRRPAWRSEHPPRKYGRDVPSLCGTLPRDRGQRAPSVARSFRVRTSTLWPRSPSLTSGGGRERESYGRCALSVPAPHGQTGRRSLPSSRHTHTHSMVRAADCVSRTRGPHERGLPACWRGMRFVSALRAPCPAVPYLRDW